MTMQQLEPTAGTGEAHLECHRRTMLSTLWIFVTLNYLYCDVLGLTDHEQLKQLLTGTVNGVDMTQGFLLGSSILMEIPIAMVILSRCLPFVACRRANVAAGVVMTLVQIGSLFVGSPTVYYAFFSAIEIAGTGFIVWYSWTWARTHTTTETSRPRTVAFSRRDATLSSGPNGRSA